MSEQKSTAPVMVVTIVVKGGNVFGQALCEAHGVWFDDRKKKHIDYSGPISGAQTLFESLQDLFTE